MKLKISEFQLVALSLFLMVLAVLLWLVYSGFFGFGLLLGMGLAKLITYKIKKDSLEVKDGEIQSNTESVGRNLLLALIPLTAIMLLIYYVSGMTLTESLLDFGLNFCKVVFLNALLYLGITTLRSVMTDT